MNNKLTSFFIMVAPSFVLFVLIVILVFNLSVLSVKVETLTNENVLLKETITAQEKDLTKLSECETKTIKLTLDKQKLVTQIANLQTKTNDLNSMYEVCRSYFIDCYWATIYVTDYEGALLQFGKDYKDYYVQSCTFGGFDNWDKIIGESR